MAKQERGSFGKIAIDAGYITEDGLREAIFIQGQVLQESGEKLNLGKILLDKGFMTKEQIIEVLSIQAKDIIYKNLLFILLPIMTRNFNGFICCI